MRAPDLLPRRLEAAVEDAFRSFPCVGLFGPREVGKTTLARQVALSRGEGAVTLDLSRSDDRASFADDQTFFARHRDKLIVLDELQHAPPLLDVVKQCVERERHTRAGATQFLLLGSSQLEVQRLCAEALGGRMQRVAVDPLHVLDLLSPQPLSLQVSAVHIEVVAAESEPIGRSNAVFDPERLWDRGGFPSSYLAVTDAESYARRRAYVAACAAREAPDVPAGTLETVLQRLAADPGSKQAGWNGRADFKACILHLERLGLVRALAGWSGSPLKRLASAAKFYIRDSGLLHALAGCRTLAAVRDTPGLLGASWEGFGIEQLVVATAGRATPYYYRRDEREEIDLLLDFGGGVLWALEIKRKRDPNPSLLFEAACRTLNVARRIHVTGAGDSAPPRRGTEILCLRDAVEAATLS